MGNKTADDVAKGNALICTLTLKKIPGSDFTSILRKRINMLKKKKCYKYGPISRMSMQSCTEV